MFDKNTTSNTYNEIPKISIVIPAYNEEGFISSCLDALTKQTTSGKFEVIVVNNNSTDNTLKIVNEYIKKLNLVIINEKRKGRSPTRLAGFINALGQIILSTDADARVPIDWVEKIMVAFDKDASVSAITGTCKIIDCFWFKNSVFNFFQPLLMKIYRLFFGHFWLSGFNFAIRKDAYTKSGGFDPNLNGLEDIDLSFKVSRAGKIKFLPDLCVTMSGRRFQKGLLKGVTPYLRSFISYYWLKRKDIYFDDPR